MSFLQSLSDTIRAAGPPAAVLLLVVVVLDLALGRRARGFWVFTPAFVLLLCDAPWWSYAAAALGGGLLVVEPLRRHLLTAPILKPMSAAGFLPRISETERTAIEAGTVWVDGELFSGRPDFDRLLTETAPELSPEEEAFLAGPVEELCRLTQDWDVQERRDLPPEVWKFLAHERFFGMIIPREFEGLGFSAAAHSAVIAKLSSRCQALAISVMVPNSLGPAELLLHHGTEEQKRHYLPRLARGQDIPCFALTEPGAGSDAGGLRSQGVVFRGADGELMLRLDWEKRYITLAAISTVLGVAFRLLDPDHLLPREGDAGGAGQGEDHPGSEDLGITCALVPSDTPGIELDRRHDPLGVPFYNCPTRGVGVEVPLDCIIGGAAGAGRGWLMLMESLAAGRGISLPAGTTGGAQLVARVASAHAAVRQQFGMSIGRFEGIEEPLARIGSHAWLLEAARRYTCGAIDSGAKPAVVTAMAKYAHTELFRKVINDGLDVLAGNGISRGPRNLLAGPYAGTPIMITVEGANILTRTLMIFGQGAIRCHPFALAEIEAAERKDLRAFDLAFWGHVAHVLGNGSRALVLSLSRGLLAFSPIGGPSARYLRRLSWASASFAFHADLAMASLGGQLKRREKLTGRFADIFCWLYLATAAIRRFEAEGRPAEQLPFLRWSCEHALARIQEAFDGIFANFGGLLGLWLGGPVALWSRLNRIGREPSDRLGQQVAQSLLVPGAARDAASVGIYLPDDPSEALGRLEEAFELCHRADAVHARLRRAVKKKKLKRAPLPELLREARAAGILGDEEVELVERAERAREDAIQVDSFLLADYARGATHAAPAAGGKKRTAKAPA